MLPDESLQIKTKQLLVLDIKQILQLFIRIYQIMANETSFVRPMLPGERQGQEVRSASKETAKAAVVGGASNLPLNAIIEFPFEEPMVFEQDRQNSDQKNYYLGAKVNGKDRCILVGTFTRTDFNGDGSPISEDVTAFARQYDNVWDLGQALLGKKLKVASTKKCKTSVWENGAATDKMRTVNYPVLEFISQTDHSQGDFSRPLNRQ